jgi:hypothetical protein
MKTKAKIEMKRLAITMAAVAVLFILSFICLLPLYLKFQSMHWEQIFRSEAVYKDFMVAFGGYVFGVAPGMILVCGRSAWVLFKHLDKISDEDAAA